MAQQVVEQTVWTLGDAFVNIFLEDGAGEVTGVTLDPLDETHRVDNPYNYYPVLDYCYMESISIKAEMPVVRRAVTGRGRRKIVVPAGGYDQISATVGHMLFRASDELNVTQIFNAHQYLRLQFLLYKLEYAGSYNASNSPFSLSFCKARSWEITGREAETISVSANFEAELIIR